MCRIYVNSFPIGASRENEKEQLYDIYTVWIPQLMALLPTSPLFNLLACHCQLD